MPPPGLHLAVARGIGERISHSVIEADAGSYYLGSTAPDIRILLRCERDQTHFFQLDNLGEQRGVHGLLQEYPQLREPSSLNAATAAFVAGYISHLEMDETWIQDIYRPYFGAGSPLGGSVRANILDRVLQYEMDCRERVDSEKIARITNELLSSDLEVEVGFIDRGSIHNWRDVVVDIVNQPPAWERFRRIAGRHLQAAGVDTQEGFEEFMRNLPDLVAEALDYLGGERIQAFLELSIDRGLEAVREYLQCD